MTCIGSSLKCLTLEGLGFEGMKDVLGRVKSMTCTGPTLDCLELERSDSGLFGFGGDIVRRSTSVTFSRFRSCPEDKGTEVDAGGEVDSTMTSSSTTDLYD